MQGFVQQAQTLLLRVVAPEEKAGIAGVVVTAVKIVKGRIGQVRDVLRIAAGIQAVQGVREQGLLALLGQDGIGRRINALHLIIDHALVGPGTVGRRGLHMPALLFEDVFADARMEQER